MQFKIYGQLKSGKNAMQTTRTGQHYPLPSFKLWRDSVLKQIPAITTIIRLPCKIEIKYWRGDERRRDVPGMQDALWHCLEKAAIIADDKLFEEVHWLPMGLDRKNPRVEIDIEALKKFAQGDDVSVTKS